MNVEASFANTLLDLTLKQVAYSPVATIYLGLFTALSGDGAVVTEVSGNGYARQSIAFDAPSTRVSSNSAVVTFPLSTASWGTISYVGLYDALTSGTLLFWSDVADEALAVDQKGRVAAAGMTATFSGGITSYLGNALLNAVLRNTSYSTTTVFAGLLTDLSDNGDTYTEVSGSGYARISATFNSAASGTTVNTDDLLFAEATSNYSADVTHVGVFDAVSGGNLLYWDAITATAVPEGQALRIKSGELTVNMN